MKLMIVESPTKAKKIQTYLGPEWNVKASIGHIRDLPEKEMGVNLTTFKADYRISRDKRKIINQLIKNAASADVIYLATDMDREGEAIAWHLKETLKISGHQYKRITFNEITKDSISSSIQNPRTINMDLVSAQETRRILDRLVGYTVSPQLNKLSGTPLSAGRVQSPALKLVFIREQDINTFESEIYYQVTGLLNNGVEVSLVVDDWVNESKHITDIELASKIAKVTTVQVIDINTEEKAVKPRPPFTTSTLQQSASTYLKMSPKDTMTNAQSLFDKGYITYHRTDNPNFSEEGFNKIKEYLMAKGLPVQETRLNWKSKASAQEAHEAIRPADIAVEQYEDLSSKEIAIYTMIKERSMTSAMPSSLEYITKIMLQSHESISNQNQVKKPRFLASGKIIKRAGWRESVVIERIKENKNEELPRDITKGKSYSIRAKVDKKHTQPPGRYTEATLIDALEKCGIGRPSTYASIMENIKHRKYIEIKSVKKEKKVFITDKGHQLVNCLMDMSFMNLGYTKQMEDHLDLIAKGEGRKYDLINEIYQTVHQQTQQLKMTSMIKLAECPLCQKQIKQLHSKKNKTDFWVHIEDNEACIKYIADQDGQPVIEPTAKTEKQICPKCKKEIIRRYSKLKDFYFWVHTNKSSDRCLDFIKDHDGKPSL